TDAADRLPMVRPARGDRVRLWGRSAHRAARQSRRAVRRAVGPIPLHAQESPRCAPRAMGARARLPAMVQRPAQYDHVQRHGGVQGGRDAAQIAMTQICRLPAGGRIDRRTRLRFTFNGKRYEGHAGDTLASALLANGVTVVARSWKKHRPRGIVACGVEEPNAVVQLETGAATVPNARATEVTLYDGLVATSVNAWPSVDFDLMAVAGLFARFMPAGFYYKTFMWPKSLWRRYEHFIRKASGLGTAPTDADPDRYDRMNAHCDVLVVGGGPAGLAAASAAGSAGARVM